MRGVTEQFFRFLLLQQHFWHLGCFGPLSLDVAAAQVRKSMMMSLRAFGFHFHKDIAKLQPQRLTSQRRYCYEFLILTRVQRCGSCTRAQSNDGVTRNGGFAEITIVASV
jgi:hypothetical protein